MENQLKPVVQAATFTVFSAENNKPVSKRLSLLPDFTLNKQSLAYNLARAIAETVTATPTQFAAGLQGLNKSQALCYGVIKHGRESAHIVTKRDTQNGFCFSEDINRSGQDFEYAPLAGVIMCDGDDPNYTVEILQQILTQMDSAFATAPAVTRPSTSSCIYNSVTGDEVRGLTGFRLYLFIDDASRISELVSLLKAHFWLGGYGHFKISSSGSLLERFPIDFAVFQANHLDYVGGADCVSPLEQRLPDPVLINADASFLDMAALIARLELSDQQIGQANFRKEMARDNQISQAYLVREKWIATRVQQMVINRKVSTEVAESVVRTAVETDELGGYFELTLQTGEVVTVAELLANPQRYHGTRCCDPLEPTYHDDNRIAYISIKVGQKPYIFSHAHGGKRYKLSRTRNTIVVEAGDTVIAVDETVKVLQGHPQVFDRGDQLVSVSVSDDAVISVSPLENHSISDFLGREIRYKKRQVAKNGQVSFTNIDPPAKVCAALESRGGSRELKPLRGVSNVPFLRNDGTVCDTVGYDQQSGILFATPDGVDTRVDASPTIKQVVEAMQLLHKPFELFPCDNDISRSVLVSELLTTACRKTLDTAPGFAIDAASAGTGKSLLATSIGILISGKTPAFLSCPTNDDEMRKTLTSLLLTGSEVIIFDNVGFKLKSMVLEAFVTASVFSDRLLGGNNMTSLLNNALFMANGNNFTIVGDLNRRLLKCRLDANMPLPHLRKFDSDPAQFVRENRMAMIRAALTIIRGYLSSGAGTMTNDSMASFEMWDKYVRQTVCWLATLPNMPMKLVDPVQSIHANYADDPLTMQVARVFEALQKVFGTGVVTSKIIVSHLDLSNELNLSAVQITETRLLREALADSLESNQPFDAKAIGNYLSSVKDRVSNGLKLVLLGTKSNGYAQWQLITI